MIDQVVILIVLGVFGLYSGIGILIWGFAVAVDSVAYYRKAVDFLSIASSAGRTLYTGVMATLSSALTIMIWWAYLLLVHHPDFQWLLVSMVFLICLFVVLWFATVAVWILARRQPYLYYLPQDAVDLRIGQCKQGVKMAATFYPKVITDEDLMDTISRASCVSMRYEIFPKIKRQKGLKAVKFTNDFAVFCNVCAEGYIQGYYGFLAAIQGAPDRLEAQRAILREWPETVESQQLMDTLASQFCK